MLVARLDGLNRGKVQVDEAWRGRMVCGNACIRDATKGGFLWRASRTHHWAIEVVYNLAARDNAINAIVRMIVASEHVERRGRYIGIVGEDATVHGHFPHTISIHGVIAGGSRHAERGEEVRQR